jgi:hypothetical protein
VFHLESLRINMDKVLSSGSNSAAEFVQELIIHLQSAFSKYAISHQATEMFSYQIAKRSEEAVEKVDLARDLQGGLGMLGGGARGLPAPVYYNNYFVGECRDLIFGVSLTVRVLFLVALFSAFRRDGMGTDHLLRAFHLGRTTPTLEGSTLPTPIAYPSSSRSASRVLSREVSTQRDSTAYLLGRAPFRRCVFSTPSPQRFEILTCWLLWNEQLIHRIEIDEEAFQFSRAEEIYTVASILKVRRPQISSTTRISQS